MIYSALEMTIECEYEKADAVVEFLQKELAEMSVRRDQLKAQVEQLRRDRKREDQDRGCIDPAAHL